MVKDSDPESNHFLAALVPKTSITPCIVHPTLFFFSQHTLPFTPFCHFLAEWFSPIAPRPCWNAVSSIPPPCRTALWLKVTHQSSSTEKARKERKCWQLFQFSCRCQNVSQFECEIGTLVSKCHVGVRAWARRKMREEGIYRIFFFYLRQRRDGSFGLPPCYFWILSPLCDKRPTSRLCAVVRSDAHLRCTVCDRAHARACCYCFAYPLVSEVVVCSLAGGENPRVTFTCAKVVLSRLFAL